MKRIIMHWTAGGHKANKTDKRRYHFIVEGDGTVAQGNHPPEANRHIPPGATMDDYAAHTGKLNTGSIGVAVAAMRGAQERPFDPGPSPITERQLDAFCALVARLALQYGIPLRQDTILTHAEVQPVLGVAQRGKWDITWLPGMKAPGDPRQVGHELRGRIQAHIARRETTPPAPTTPETKPGLLTALLSALAGLFRRK